MLIVFGAPFVVAALLGAVRPRRALLQWWPLAALGLIFAVGVFGYMYAYTPASAFYETDECPDCTLLIRRDWEPAFGVLVAVVAYVVWLAGLAAGSALRQLAHRRRASIAD